ncbi:hypothetical protein K2173_004979 [Erythroxylum novogranatense]|uniref:Uncharacterized protein n=1 Tax=Erythroxylum novogranatense TaxID=1862640 RepID=A0AAV8TCZ0_9ROSI|nr:hypothetical protein K2173_004979 [Erythroxylum novogranatense]
MEHPCALQNPLKPRRRSNPLSRQYCPPKLLTLQLLLPMGLVLINMAPGFMSPDARLKHVSSHGRRTKMNQSHKMIALDSLPTPTMLYAPPQAHGAKHPSQAPTAVVHNSINKHVALSIPSHTELIIRDPLFQLPNNEDSGCQAMEEEVQSPHSSPLSGQMHLSTPPRPPDPDMFDTPNSAMIVESDSHMMETTQNHMTDQAREPKESVVIVLIE